MSFASVPLAAIAVGGYISIVKVVFVLLVLMLWAKLLTFADKDATVAHLPRESLNLGMLLGMAGSYALFFLLPSFFLGFPVLLAGMAIEVAVYINMRKKSVGLSDLKEDFAQWKKGFKKGDKTSAEAGKVSVIAKNNQPVPVPKGDSPDRAGYDAVQTLLTDPLIKGAERIELTPGEGPSQMRFVVDGVAYNGATVDRSAGASGITYLKYFAGIDINEKRKPQAGTLKVILDGKKRDLEVNTAGSSAGEFLKILIDPKKRHALRLDGLGLTTQQFDAVKEAINDNTGVVLVAAPKQQGLTSMLYALLRSHDAFLQHIQTVERAPDADVEGVTQNKLPANAPAGEESKLIGWVSSQEPDVIMINQVEDPKTVSELLRYVGSGEKPRRVYIGMRAANTFEAMTQWRKLVGDDQLAMKHLRMVLCGRIMRKLCMACKVAYTPDPEQLRKLNLNPASGATLFQARTQPIRDPKGNPIPCEFCKEIRYNGRFGVFELLVVDDDVRNIVISGGSVNQLKAAFRKQKGKLLQEMALAKVESGDTSVQEVLRVLKSDQPAAAATGRGSDGEVRHQPPALERPALRAPRSSPRPSRTPPARSSFDIDSLRRSRLNMTLGIIFILLVALIGFVHYLQGFFSGIISAVIAIMSALLAVGWYENVLALIKPGKFADLAPALILCGLFVVTYLILRILFDRLIPGNVRVKSTFDKIGGAVMGLVAGIFTVGLLAVALQSMPLGPSIGGYARYLTKDETEVRVPMLDGPAKDRKIYDSMKEARFEPADQAKLIFPVDDMLVGLVNSASNGSLSGNSFSAIHPDWLQEMFGQRLGIEIGAKHSANNLGSTPEIAVSNLYFVTTATDVRDAEVPQVRGEAALENAPPGKAIPKKDNQMVQNFKAYIAKKPALVIRTQINHNATDADNLFRVSLGAVRLVVKGADGSTKDYHPIGTVDETGTFFLNRVDDPIVVTSLEEAYVDFAFDVSPDDVALPAEGNKDRTVKPGTFFEVKRFGRVDLEDPPRTIATVPRALRVDPVPKLDPVLRKSLIKKPPVVKEGA